MLDEIKSIFNKIIYVKPVNENLSKLESLPVDLHKIILPYLKGKEIFLLTSISNNYLVLATDLNLWKEIIKREPQHLQQIVQENTWLQSIMLPNELRYILKTPHPMIQFQKWNKISIPFLQEIAEEILNNANDPHNETTASLLGSINTLIIAPLRKPSLVLFILWIKLNILIEKILLFNLQTYIENRLNLNPTQQVYYADTTLLIKAKLAKSKLANLEIKKHCIAQDDTSSSSWDQCKQTISTACTDISKFGLFVTNNIISASKNLLNAKDGLEYKLKLK